MRERVARGSDECISRIRDETRSIAITTVARMLLMVSHLNASRRASDSRGPSFLFQTFVVRIYIPDADGEY